MKARIAFVGLAVISTVIASSLAQGNDPIKIGAAFNVTGGYSSLDAPALAGAKLAAKEINAAGALLGRQIQLVEYDGKSDQATVANVAAQLVDSDKVVGAVGFADSDMALAFGPITQKQAFRLSRVAHLHNCQIKSVTRFSWHCLAITSKLPQVRNTAWET